MTVILESATKVAADASNEDTGRNETAMKTVNMEDPSELTSKGSQPPVE